MEKGSIVGQRRMKSATPPITPSSIPIFFLSKVIALLQENDQHFETAMFSISDHGESRGEYGVYLHGMPYLMMAPETQKHIAAIMWFGSNFLIDTAILRGEASREYSHDNLFHTLLGSMEIHTEEYTPALDVLSNAHKDAARNKTNQKESTNTTPK